MIEVSLAGGVSVGGGRRWGGMYGAGFDEDPGETLVSVTISPGGSSLGASLEGVPVHEYGGGDSCLSSELIELCVVFVRVNPDVAS